ncbi:MAG: YfhO family protein [Anaerolineae bacterium]|nr:YfhO family protein [Anaerolineae bacterium]
MIISEWLYRVHRFDRRLGSILPVFLLILLWGLFFWRMLTSAEADQVSFTQGDFSGQFFTFAGYQYARFAQGEVPLWNPYNNGGLPFIADTQAAVFYPPRLLTLALANLSGGWTYHALELEALFHVLGFTLLMYAFARRLTGSPFGGLTAAIIAGYGGFLTGYPLLQLAILEAGVWLPVAALGIVEATAAPRLRYSYLLWTGFALGMSWLAGHPQTSFFLTYFLAAYFGFQVFQRRATALQWLTGTAWFGVVALGIAAVQLLPGVEYLSRTTRVDFGFDAKDNGFPLHDIVQMIMPGVVSLWSPLYVGVTGLILALIGVWRRRRDAWFWGIVALLALLWGFGGNAAVFPALYSILPGLRFFRGQERAAYLVVTALAILAALGITALGRWDAEREHLAGLRLRLALNRSVYGALALTALVFMSWIGSANAYGRAFSAITLAAAAVVVCYLLISAAVTRQRRAPLLWGIILTLVFEVFTVNMNHDAVVDPLQPQEQVAVSAPPPVASVLADLDGVFRVDGLRGLTANYGSLYGLQDIRGISPLWLAGPYAIVEGSLPDERAWELFAVRYVFSDWMELPVPSEIVETGPDAFGVVNLHRLSAPRPFALILYDTWITADDAEALTVLADPAFQPRRTIILETPVALESGEPTPAQVASFAPERIVIVTDARARGALSIALPYYPGWTAQLDGEPVDILRAYGALSAVIVPPGRHTVELLYNPMTYRVGLILSLITWLCLGIGGGIAAIRRISRDGSS